jgi:hypothetical protein
VAVEKPLISAIEKIKSNNIDEAVKIISRLGRPNQNARVIKENH